MDFFHKYEEYRTLILDFYAELVYYNVSKMSPASIGGGVHFLTRWGILSPTE